MLAFGCLFGPGCDWTIVERRGRRSGCGRRHRTRACCLFRRAFRRTRSWNRDLIVGWDKGHLTRLYGRGFLRLISAPFVLECLLLAGREEKYVEEYANDDTDEPADRARDPCRCGRRRGWICLAQCRPQRVSLIDKLRSIHVAKCFLVVESFFTHRTLFHLLLL